MAGLRLNKNLVLWAISHCHEYGDTDIFPKPIEYQWFFDQKEEVAEIISKIDLNTYEPKSGLTYLTPKNLLGFRTADQLFPLDQIIFLSCVLAFWREIEQSRVGSKNAFSYRIQPQKDFSLFTGECSFGDWIKSHLALLKRKKETRYILSTDIADFYQRINHHRLENCLNSITENPLKKIILKQLSNHRAKYSFGIPVGNNGSRILSELLLTDTDEALLAEGFEFSRYVDDYRFFLKDEEEAYKILAFLAEHLYLTEGLTLSRQKTKIETTEEYIERHEAIDEGADAEEAAIRELSYSIYESDEPDPKEIAKLASYNLVERLAAELEKIDPDANRVKVLLSALKSIKDPEVIPLLLERLNLLLPFMREVAILVEYLGKDDPDSVAALKPVFLDLLEGDNSYLPITRVWILELFAKGIFTLEAKEFKELESLVKSSDPLEQRQILICAGHNRVQTFFRRNRANFDSFSDWAKPAFIYGARCFERDEFSHWSKSIKPRLDQHFGSSLLSWIKKL